MRCCQNWNGGKANSSQLNLATLALSLAASLVTGAAGPIFVTTDPNGGWPDGDCHVHNNAWNCVKDIMKRGRANGWFSSKSTLDQICFGVEIVSTDDTAATFQVAGFSLNAKFRLKLGYGRTSR